MLSPAKPKLTKDQRRVAGTVRGARELLAHLQQTRCELLHDEQISFARGHEPLREFLAPLEADLAAIEHDFTLLMVKEGVMDELPRFRQVDAEKATRVREAAKAVHNEATEVRRRYQELAQRFRDEIHAHRYLLPLGATEAYAEVAKAMEQLTYEDPARISDYRVEHLDEADRDAVLKALQPETEVHRQALAAHQKWLASLRALAPSEAVRLIATENADRQAQVVELGLRRQQRLEKLIDELVNDAYKQLRAAYYDCVRRIADDSVLHAADATFEQARLLRWPNDDWGYDPDDSQQLGYLRRYTSELREMLRADEASA